MELIRAKLLNSTDVGCLGVPVRTFILEYPRYIHSQVMTHRIFSRNATSSRAIKLEKMLKGLDKNFVIPKYWGAKQRGMQAYSQIAPHTQSEAIHVWYEAYKNARRSALALDQLGVHQQVVNRLLEPFMIIRVMLTGDDFDNFLKLRTAHDSQPEIQELALKMQDCIKRAPKAKVSDVHLPYPDYTVAQNIAAAAFISYNNPPSNDVVKCERMLHKLMADGHESPSEHVVYEGVKNTKYCNLMAGRMQFRQDYQNP